MNKATRNYRVDVVIGFAFLVTAISALAFLVPLNWIDFSASTTPTVLGVNYGVWQLLHKWGGIAMLVGVALHLMLHWRWILTMTKKAMPTRKSSEQEQTEAAYAHQGE